MTDFILFQNNSYPIFAGWFIILQMNGNLTPGEVHEPYHTVSLQHVKEP